MGSFRQRRANGETLAHCVLVGPHGPIRREGAIPVMTDTVEQPERQTGRVGRAGLTSGRDDGLGWIG